MLTFFLTYILSAPAAGVFTKMKVSLLTTCQLAAVCSSVMSLHFTRGFQKRIMHSSKHASITERAAAPYAVGGEVEVQIVELTNEGRGLGRLPCTNGTSWVVMVPFALPNETVKCRIMDNFKSYSVAALTSIVIPSKDRIVPACKYFGTCGGCHYQNLNYESQLKWKREQIISSLRYIGKFTDVPVNPVVPSPKQLGYRSKMTPHVQRMCGGDGSDSEDAPPQLRVGFQMAESNTVIDIDRCLLVTDPVNEQYNQSRSRILADADSSSVPSQLFFRHSASDDSVTTDQDQIISANISGLNFNFRAGDFFQTNLFALPTLIEHVRGQLNALPQRPKHLVEAYCGCGIFGVSLAKSFSSVIGIEINANAISQAKANAIANRMHNCKFTTGDSEELFGDVELTEQSPFRAKGPKKKAILAKKAAALPVAQDTVVLLDPPREGCSQLFIKKLLQYRPNAIVYVSCNPASQARDVQRLCSSGVYVISDVTPFDMFANTKHLECVIVLTKKAKEVKV